MKAASGYCKVIPDDPFYLIGYFNKERNYPALGIHDAPYCVCLLLEAGGKRVLLISLDTCIVTKDRAAEIRRTVREVLKIDESAVIISAIHSHSCPNGLDTSFLSKVDNPNYFNKVKDAIRNLAETLEEKMEPVKATYSVTPVEGYFNNRIDPNAVYDKNIIRVYFRNEKSELKGMICSISCHATVVGNRNMLCSSDLLGNIREHIFKHYGIMPYISTGASADVSNRNYRQGNDFNELERVGNGIFACMLSEETEIPVSIEKLSIKEYSYHVYHDNSSEKTAVKEQLLKINEQLKWISDIEAEKDLISRKVMLEGKLLVDVSDFIVKCMIVEADELRMITFPGELAACFGIELNNINPYRCSFLIGYANDYLGYFMNQEVYGKCYETTATHVPKGETEKIVKQLGEHL